MTKKNYGQLSGELRKLRADAKRIALQLETAESEDEELELEDMALRVKFEIIAIEKEIKQLRKK